jgi:hypothetical protein
VSGHGCEDGHGCHWYVVAEGPQDHLDRVNLAWRERALAEETDRRIEVQRELDYAWSSRDMWRERALAAEARVRDLEEAVGELLALMPSVVDVKHIPWPPR